MTYTPMDNLTQQQVTLPPANGLGLRVFWLTLLVLVVATLVIALIGVWRLPEPAPVPHEVPATTLERVLSNVATKAEAVVRPDIGILLDKAYEPAYAAIEGYADFHYSVAGEYMELGAAAMGNMGDALHARVFGGLEQRLASVAGLIDQGYADAYSNILNAEIASVLPQDQIELPLGRMTQAVLQDAQNRAVITVPLASAASAAVVASSLKAASAAAGKKLAAKVAAKAAAKGAAKGGSALAGAAASALACAWAGPVAVACGVVGGVVTWVLVDGAVITIDEYFNREEFEAELRAMLDEDKAARQRFLEQALAQKAAAMDAAVEEMIRDFTLRELSPGVPASSTRP